MDDMEDSRTVVVRGEGSFRHPDDMTAEEARRIAEQADRERGEA